MEEVTKPKRARKPKVLTTPPKEPKAKEAPDADLVMELCAPGMGPLHRAGLGGLACTLNWIQNAYANDQLNEEDLPSGPWEDGPPWKITPDCVTLKFGEAGKTKEYLEKLFALAFGLKDDLIFLPGQYGKVSPGQAVRADLQQGLTLTFLQHGLTRSLAKNPSVVTHDIDDGDSAPITIEFKACSRYKHQKLWESLIKKGSLTTETVELDGPISPGTTLRHVGLGNSSKAEQPPHLALPAFFSIVGTLALAVNRGVGVLLVPEVIDLLEFTRLRPLMTPRRAKEMQVTNAADAALQAWLRLKAGESLSQGIPSVSTMTLRPTAWASQQKSRVHTLVVRIDDHPRMLDRFKIAMSHLKQRVVVPTEKPTAKKRTATKALEAPRPFRSDSLVRPLVAENLATGRKWYEGFTRLMTAKDPANNKPLRNRLSFEREGLNAMTKEKDLFDREGEQLLVGAVHEAIRGNLGRIRKETDGENAKGLSQSAKNRMEKFREGLRLSLVGAKTGDQVRHALMDVFTRAKSKNTALRDQWPQVLPIIREDWKLARDLGLLALVSYKGKSREEELPEAATGTETTEA